MVKKLRKRIQLDADRSASITSSTSSATPPDVLSFTTDGGAVLIEVFLNISLDDLPHGAHQKPIPYEKALQEAEAYREIPVGQTYTALDRHFRPLLVVFPDAFDRTYGPEAAKEVIKDMTNNIELLARFVKPPREDGARHETFKDWIHSPSNAHFWMGDHDQARCGVYHFGYWMEQGWEKFGPIASADTQSSSAKRRRLIAQFMHEKLC